MKMWETCDFKTRKSQVIWRKHERRLRSQKSLLPRKAKCPKPKPPGRQREDIRLASRSVAISSVIRSDLRDNVDEVVSVVDVSEDVEDIITVMMGMVGLGAGGEL